MKIRLFILTFVLSTLTLQAIEESRDVERLNIIQDRSTPTGQLWRQNRLSNPATTGYCDSISISEAGVSFNYAGDGTTTIPQSGDGLSNIILNIDSYYKLTHNTTVWGHASYESVKYRNISQTNNIDYFFIAPYTLGDDTGGDITGQSYRFGGGWNHTYHSWTLGIEANYRAVIAHRSIDPRIKDLISDLDITIGGGLHIGDSYTLSMHTGVRIYHQESDVDFYNPANIIMTHLYTGLNSIHNRFDNNTTSNSGHSGQSLLAGLQFMRHDSSRTGPQLQVSYQYTTVDMNLRDINDITVASASTSTLCGSMQWFIGLNDITITPSLSSLMMIRRGTENLFGTPVGGGYDMIGRRPNYKHDITAVNIAIPVEWRPERQRLTLTLAPVFQYSRSTECLLTPYIAERKSCYTTNLNFCATLKLPYASLLSLNTLAPLSRQSPYGAGIRLSKTIRHKILGLSANYTHATPDIITYKDNFLISLSLSF